MTCISCMQFNQAPGSRTSDCPAQLASTNSQEEQSDKEKKPMAQARKQPRQKGTTVGFVSVDFSSEEDTGDINYVHDGRSKRRRGKKKQQASQGTTIHEGRKLLLLYFVMREFCRHHGLIKQAKRTVKRSSTSPRYSQRNHGL